MKNHQNSKDKFHYKVESFSSFFLQIVERKKKILFPVLPMAEKDLSLLVFSLFPTAYRTID